MDLTGKFKGSCLSGRFSATIFRYCLMNDVAYFQGNLIWGAALGPHGGAFG
jgi:hypothetical protein